ncbi:MAG: hypothetical protein ACJAZX_000691 [Rickettsiales bacterium]|jgi:hypothetical protein
MKEKPQSKTQLFVNLSSKLSNKIFSKFSRKLSGSFFSLIIPVFFLLTILTPVKSWSWTGYDRQNGSEIEISSGNLVRDGEQIRFYDWQSDEDRKAEVEDIQYFPNSVKLEIYDYSADKTRIFDMVN